MQRLILGGVAASLMIVTVAETQAGPRNRGDNAAAEQNLLRRAEWDRARKIGGYEDPITALRNLFNGTPTARTIQPNLNVTGNETFQDFQNQIDRDLAAQE